MQDTNLFFDLVSDELSSETKQELIALVRKALTERLQEHPKPINERSLKEAILFANVKFMQAIPKSCKAALSTVVILHNKVDQRHQIMMGGIGDFKVYALDRDLLELVFVDPINSDLSSHLSLKKRFESLKNALGRANVPQIHVRKLSRSHLEKLLVVSYGSYNALDETQLVEKNPIKPSEHDLQYHLLDFQPPLKQEQTPSKKNPLLIFTLLASILALAGSFFYQPKQKTEEKKPQIDFSSRKTEMMTVSAELQKELDSLKKKLYEQSALLIDLQEEKSILEEQLKELQTTPKKVMYTVVPGDTLSTISQKNYGTVKRWKDILETNKDTITSQHSLKPGIQLVIPP